MITTFVYGGGPKMRAICARLLSSYFPDSPAMCYQTLEAAMQRAGGCDGPVLLLDARVAPAEQILSFVRVGGVATARAFDGSSPEATCALMSKSGRTLDPHAAPNFGVIGDWLVATGSVRAASRGLNVEVRANGAGYSGYAVAGRHLMIGLDRAGVDVTWCADWVENEAADMPFDDEQLLAGLARKSGCAPDLTVVHNTPTRMDGRSFLELYRDFIVPRSPLIWATMFETDSIPSRWAERLNRCQAVWVPCSQNLDSFARGGVRPDLLHRVPIGLDIENYDIDGAAMHLPHQRAFNFLSVFEWRLRKGYDVLLKAYAAAFTPSDDVALYIRSSLRGTDVRAALHGALAELGLDHRKMPPIILLPDKVPQSELPSLYRAMDAFVLPSRGEAFGIPYVEAMALGLPVIGTAFGGPLDYLNVQTGYPIPCTLVPVDRAFAQKMPLYDGQRWAEPSLEATAAAMRAVFDDRAAASQKAAVAAATVRSTFNRESAGRIAAAALERTPRRVTRASKPVPRLRYVAVAASLAGYGSETRSFLSALQRQSIDVELMMYDYENLDAQLRPEESRLIKSSRRLRAPDGSPILYHLLPLQIGDIPQGRLSVIRTMEETDGLADGWNEALRRFDQIWVPSTFNAESFERSGVDHRKLRIVPGAIDTDFWSPAIGGMIIDGIKTFRFLAVFDWMGRKGWDILLTAYMRAFSWDDDVSLTLKITDLVAKAENREINAIEVLDQFVRKVVPEKSRLGKTPKVLLISQRLSEDDLARTYGDHDVFVGPSHAEGWGRAHMEAMSCGLPTIGTRWGGNLAFMNDENSYLIDIEGLVDAQGDTGRYVGRRWAQPSVEHLEQLLRRVYERPEEARARGMAARREIVEKFSLAAVGSILRERLEEITQFDFPLMRSSIKEYEPDDLCVIVDASKASQTLSDCVNRLLRHTRSEFELVVWCDRTQERAVRAALAQVHGTFRLETSREAIMESARSFTYVAIVKDDVMVSLAWDRILIAALTAQLNAGCVVPRFVNVGEQPEERQDPLYNLQTLESFDSFAIDRMINSNATGAYSRSLPLLCMIVESPLYNPQPGSLFPTLFPAGYECWTAFDCLAHFVAPNAS